MEQNTQEYGVKYKPEYEWPTPDTTKDCPRCNDQLELIEKQETYYGKPWWCAPCQWQFSEEDLKRAELDSREEE